MRPSLRFLTIAVLGWAGVRAASLGALPGAEMFRIERGEAKAPPIVPTQFPAIEPIPPAEPGPPVAYASTNLPSASPMAAVTRYVQGVVGVPVALRRGIITVCQLPPASAPIVPAAPVLPARLASRSSTFDLNDYSPLPSLDSLSRVASLAGPTSRPSAVSGQSTPMIDPRRIDRLQLSTWALLRGRRA